MHVRISSCVRSSSVLFNALRGFSSTSELRDSSKRYRGVGQRGVAEDAINPLSKATAIDKGALHVVSTPIGNLKDFSLRALEVLRKVDYIVCTNRQATKYLLELVDVDGSGRLIHYRSNGNAKLVEMLRGGRSIALVAPAGTPCVGDEGNAIVAEMLANNIRVVSVPGPCAAVAALSTSGAASSLADGSFYFGGALPERQGLRLSQLRRYNLQFDCPIVLYEYPRRLLTVLSDIASVMPKRRISLHHELTKLHESMHADTAEELLKYYMRGEALKLVSKGQIVLVIAAPPPSEAAAVQNRDELYYNLVENQKTSTGGDAWAASQMVANTLHVPSSVVLEGHRAIQSRKVGLTKQQAPVGSEGELPAQRRQRLLRAFRRARRERLIRKIEQKQEKLRLTMLKHTTGG